MAGKLQGWNTPGKPDRFQETCGIEGRRRAGKVAVADDVRRRKSSFVYARGLWTWKRKESRDLDFYGGEVDQ